MQTLKFMVALAAFLLAITGAGRTAWAGEVVFKRHTVVDFGDDTIEGDLSKPDGAYLESRKRLRHQRLIKVRENFRAEILQSVTGL
jgi:hypothetical protein